MLILPQYVEVSWNNFSKKHYIDKGYLYTKNGLKFMVNVEDLQDGCHSLINVLCDYCEEVCSKEYKGYIRGRKHIKKDSCDKCKSLKCKDSVEDTYGVSNVFELKDTKEKSIETNLLKYGVANVFQNEEIKLKQQQTVNLIYGTDNVFQNEEIKAKSRVSLIKNHGVTTPYKNKEIRDKGKATCLINFGTENPMQNSEIRSKAVKTLYSNGTCPVSSLQLKIFNLLKDAGYEVELNYPLGNFSLDCAIFIQDIKIDLEYDGWYWHKDNHDKDYNRDVFTKSQGWKVIRIKSKIKIPSKIEIEEAIHKLVNTDLEFIEMVMDDWTTEREVK